MADQALLVHHLFRRDADIADLATLPAASIVERAAGVGGLHEGAPFRDDAIAVYGAQRISTDDTAPRVSSHARRS